MMLELPYEFRPTRSKIVSGTQLLGKIMELIMFVVIFGRANFKVESRSHFLSKSAQNFSVTSPCCCEKKCYYDLSPSENFEFSQIFKIGDHLPPEKPRNVNNSLNFCATKFFFCKKDRPKYFLHACKISEFSLKNSGPLVRITGSASP